jgi:hypothetical protein
MTLPAYGWSQEILIFFTDSLTRRQGYINQSIISLGTNNNAMPIQSPTAAGNAANFICGECRKNKGKSKVPSTQTL